MKINFKSLFFIVFSTVFIAVLTTYGLNYFLTKPTTLSEDPLFYTTKLGLRKKIDTTIKVAKSGDYNYLNDSNIFTTSFKSNLTVSEAVKYEKDGSSLSFSTPKDQVFGMLSDVTPSPSGNQLTYSNVFTDTDFKYTISSTRLLEEIIVKSKETAEKMVEIKQIAKTKNITSYYERDDAIYFKNGDKDVLVLPRPVLYEHDNRYSESFGIKYDIVQDGDNYVIKKVISDEGKKWLSSPDRIYPIVIDLVVIDNADVATNWVSSDTTNTPVTQETTIKNGGTGSTKATTVAPSSTTVDLMEYSSDGLAQAGYVTNSITAGATGGTITTSGVDTIHTFTTNGSFVPAADMTAQVLIVGGGGAGGTAGITQYDQGIAGGGGGGGGVIYNASMAITSGTKAITVGGAATASTFNGYSATGGANAGQGAGGAAGTNGLGGGSVPIGSKGGGGGGGNTQAGSNSTGSQCGGTCSYGGAGGTGYTSSISGSSLVYGSGGGGAGADSPNGNGAAGGSRAGTGGSCASGFSSAGGAGTANSGGGGGGGGSCFVRSSSGGAGGSGIVIIRYGTPPYLQSYSEATIKTQGSYALKGIATQTTSANKTLTKTIGSPIDLSSINSVTFDIRATRTGSNIKVGLRDSGGIVTEVTPNIASANVFQSATIDLSGVTAANKDAINAIIITIVDATAANTFYIDNMLPPVADSINDTITLTKPATDLSAATDITFWVRSSVAGSFARFEFGEAVSSEQTYPFTISSPNTWEQKTWDISAIAAASRNAVTKYAVKFTSSTSGATFYIDDLGSLTRPSAPTLLTHTTLDSQSIRWRFTDTSAIETGFKVYDTSNVMKVDCPTPNIQVCVENGLAVNTQYTRKIVAYNADGNSAYTSNASLYTSADAPPLPTVTNRLSTSIQVNPNLGTNPASTELAIYKEVGTTCDGVGGSYVAANGSDNGATAVWQTDAVWATVTVTGLSQERAYSFCVKARNGNNLETAFGTVNPPINGAIVPLSGDFNCQGSLNSNTLINRYEDANNPGKYIIGVDTGTGSTNDAKVQLSSGCTMTMNSTDTLVTGTIDLSGGSITNLNSGAKILLNKPIYVIDTDGDGYVREGKLHYGSPLAGAVRRNQITTMLGPDCNDALAGHNYTLPSATYYADADQDTYTFAYNSGTAICANAATWDTATAVSIPNTPSTAATFALGSRMASAGASADCNDSNASAYLTVNGYADSDADGYGSGSLVTCGATGISYVATNTDCGPNTATAYPGSTTCSSTSFLNASSQSTYDYDCSASGLQNSGTSCSTTYYTGTTATFSEWQTIVGSCVPNSGPNCNSVGSAAACGAAGYTMGSSTKCGDASCGNTYTMRGSSGTQACK